MTTITEDNVLDFFRAHRAPCPVCQADDWMIGNHNEPAILLVKRNDQNAMECYAALCSNCGYVRMHSCERVDHWIRNHKITKHRYQ